MTAIKESSTRNANKKITADLCPVNYIMNRMGGYWKPIIFYQLMSGPKRYSDLRRAIPGLTEKMLIQNLKQMETDNIVIRKSKPVVPPYVIYSLSPAGEELRPILISMAHWSIKNCEETYKDHFELYPLPTGS
jgi:DNA-binding HxlR family transcriptional regulator